MDDTADLQLADHVAAAVCDAIAAMLRTTTDPAALDRYLRLLRLVWAGETTPLTGRELDAFAAEAAGRGVLRLAPPLTEATFPAGLARTLLALTFGLAPHLPPGTTLSVAGDPAVHVVLTPEGPGAAWPSALTAAFGAACDIGPVAYALKVARAAGWRPQLLLGAGSGPPPLLLAASS